MENSALWAAKRPLKEDEIWVTGNMHSPALRCWNWNALNGGFHVNIRPLQRDTHSARPTRAAGALGSDPLALMNLTLSDYKAPDRSGYILANRLPTTSSNRQSKLWYTPITNTRWVTRKAQCYFLFSQHGTIERHKARGLRSKRRGTS